MEERFPKKKGKIRKKLIPLLPFPRDEAPPL